MQSGATLNQTASEKRATSVRRGRFFQSMSVALLVIALFGFARTLFLRPLFHVPPIPWYLYVHGFIMTSWFALLVTQTSLIAAHRTDLHRRVGIAGAFLAIAVVGMSLVAVLTYPHRSRSLDFTARSVTVWTDFAFLVTFSTLVAFALSLRTRPDIHRRLMLLASIAIIGPAVGRIAFVAHDAGFPLPLALIATNTLVLLGLPLAMLVHDMRTSRRPHPATTIAVVWFFALLVGSIAVSGSDVGHAVVKALE